MWKAAGPGTRDATNPAARDSVYFDLVYILC